MWHLNQILDPNLNITYSEPGYMVSMGYHSDRALEKKAPSSFELDLADIMYLANN